MTGHGKIAGLDGIRAIAVLLVIFSHHMLWESLGIVRSEHPAFARLVNPQSGVKIFFVLSGFLITYLLLREHATYGRIDLKKFYMRRILRLAPLYFLAVTFVFVMWLIGAARMEPRSFFYLFTYTQNYQPKPYTFSATSHLWSLAVEEHFYLLWPLLFLVSRKLAVVVGGIFIGLSLQFGGGLDPHYTFPAALAIAAGCLLAFILRNGVVQRTLSIATVRYATLAISMLGILSPWFIYRDVFFVTGVMGLIAFVVMDQRSWIVRLLDFRPLALLGVMSYGAYVWHGILGGTGPYRSPGSAFPMDMHVGLVLTCIVVPMSYYGFERPFLQMKDRFRQRNPDAIEAVVVPNAPRMADGTPMVADARNA